MCLSKVQLKLQYDKQSHSYIGYGYKAFSKYYDYKRYKNWIEASGNRYNNDCKLFHSLERAYDSEDYIPGFHIFLEEKDARNYNNDCAIIVKVKFKEVLAFGTNETYITKNYGPCVVARYMKLVEVLK